VLSRFPRLLLIVVILQHIFKKDVWFCSFSYFIHVSFTGEEGGLKSLSGNRLSYDLWRSITCPSRSLRGTKTSSVLYRFVHFLYLKTTRRRGILSNIFQEKSKSYVSEKAMFPQTTLRR
jgi:hypothetical protein